MVARNWKIVSTARSRTRPPYQPAVQHWTTPRLKRLACRWKNWTSIKGTGAPQIRASSFSSATTQMLAKAGKPEPPVIAILATRMWGHVSEIHLFPVYSYPKNDERNRGVWNGTTYRVFQRRSTTLLSPRGSSSTPSTALFKTHLTVAYYHHKSL